jgi:histidyl-tRNA synthetase
MKMNHAPSMSTFQTVKGFRDFFPEECANRNYIFDIWRTISRRYGFVEYEGPVVESTDLFRKKSGDEITKQLFCFQDKAEREISLRPEVTPSLARMASARQRDYKKPLKWFQIGSCFRYELPQLGRSREFVQFNADILEQVRIGVPDDQMISAEADAELVALAIDVMRGFGFTAQDFEVRLSNRCVWRLFFSDYNVAEHDQTTFLQIIDKMERTPADVTEEKLRSIGLSIGNVKKFMGGIDKDHNAFAQLRRELEDRDLWKFVQIDPGIVRGLAYYTGMVFEIFDLKHDLRAIAGGGRYDNLSSLMTDGKVKMDSCGFAMGDVVLGELIRRNPASKHKLDNWVQSYFSLDCYLLIADAVCHRIAMKALQSLRESGMRCDFSMTKVKLQKQFQAAEDRKARFAIVFESMDPAYVTLTNLITRWKAQISLDLLVDEVQRLLAEPAIGPLIA